MNEQPVRYSELINGSGADRRWLDLIQDAELRGRKAEARALKAEAELLRGRAILVARVGETVRLRARLYFLVDLIDGERWGHNGALDDLRKEAKAVRTADRREKYRPGSY